nr:unnamed protein product [Callosobruchus chinensis]
MEIMKKTVFVIGLIQESTHLDIRSIYLTLQKICLDTTFAELGNDFGVSESAASRIFSKSVGAISQVVGGLVSWVSPAKVKARLPIPFSKVCAIIDCLEIEIQKPEDPIKQALTWSDYKKTHTMKYLVSSTPDGVINFISKGFGGRTSDTEICKESGYLDKLKPNMHIMADRGFKHINKSLAEKQCLLVRLPRVESGKKLSKLKALEMKSIDSLRTHIERVIRRLREFKMLEPDACIHVKLIPYLDFIINIACGIVNTQGTLSGK